MISAQELIFENLMNSWFKQVNRDIGTVNANENGLGAAGGFALPFMAMGHARLTYGFDFVAKEISLEDEIEWADIVITGEGSIDKQSLEGKGPVGLARLAALHGKKTIGLTGKWDENDREDLEKVFWKIFPLSKIPKKLPQALAECRGDIISTVKSLMPQVLADY
jgi:glycerate 2-kinase